MGSNVFCQCDPFIFVYRGRILPYLIYFGGSMSFLFEQSGDTKSSLDNTHVYETKMSDEKLQAESLSPKYVPSVQDLHSYPTDNRKYRLIKLANGLTVFLIENNKAELSKVLMKISVGYLDEPKTYPGLAHFLEHMVFMGSERFPNENEFSEFISNHGGNDNGSTSESETDFQFEIEQEHLEDGLDRFSSFFISPLLKEDCAEREVNAVDSEFRAHLEEDNFHCAYVMQAIANPDHPFSCFDCGNSQTLGDTKNVLIALKQFYSQHYTANRMTLIIDSDHSLDEQEVFVAKYFSTIRHSSQTYQNIVIQNPRYLREGIKKGLGIKVQIASPEKNNVLHFNFVITHERTLELEQAMQYLTFLLNGREKDGLYDVLKASGLIEERTAKGEDSAATVGYPDNRQVELTLKFPATELGLADVEKVTAYILNYIDFVRKIGIDSRIFKDLQELNKLMLNCDAECINQELQDFMRHLTDYPIERFFVGARILPTDHFPNVMIQKILKELTLDNLQVFILQRQALPKEVCVEPYVGARYIVDDLDRSPSQSIKIENVNFKLPESSANSPFIPTDFRLMPTSPRFTFPILIYAEDNLSVFLSQEQSTPKPSLTTQCLLVTPLINDTPFNATCNLVYLSMLSELIQKEMITDFLAANASPTIQNTTRGLKIEITGLSDKHDVLFYRFIDFLIQLSFDKEHFENTRRNLVEQFSNLGTLALFNRGIGILEILLNGNRNLGKTILPLLKNLKLEDILSYKNRLFDYLSLEVYSHGNTTSEATITVAKKIASKISDSINTDKKRTADTLHQSKIVQLPRGSFKYFFRSELNDNAFFLYLQVPDNHQQSGHMLKMLTSIIKPQLFEQLRTIETLAYTVTCDYFPIETYHGFLIYMESPGYDTEYLLERTENFLRLFDKYLENLAEDDFVSIRDSLNRTHQKSIAMPKSIAATYKDEFDNGTYRFSDMYCVQEPFKKITHTMLLAFYRELTDEKTRRQLLVQKEDPSIDPEEIQMTLLTFGIEGRPKELILSYYSDLKAHEETRVAEATVITDGTKFKQNAQYFPDCLLMAQEKMVSTNQALLTVGLDAQPADIILTYCFDNYRSQYPINVNNVLVSKSLVSLGQPNKVAGSKLDNGH